MASTFACFVQPRKYKFDLHPFSAGTSSLAHLLDIFRGGDKKRYSTMPYLRRNGQEGVEMGPKEPEKVSPLSGTSPTNELPNVSPVPPHPFNSSLVALDVWGSVPSPAISPPIPPPCLPPTPSFLIPALHPDRLLLTLEMQVAAFHLAISPTGLPSPTASPQYQSLSQPMTRTTATCVTPRPSRNFNPPPPLLPPSPSLKEPLTCRSHPI